MKARGIQLQYRFSAEAQHGAAVENPLFDLLQAVRAHGSIQHAARALGASYRHVWGALKQWEGTLGEPLVTWVRGQPARLTPFADRLLWAETRARTRLVPHIEALRAELAHVLAEAFDGDHHVLTIHASHDLALPRLREAAARDTRLHVELKFTGSVDALQDLGEGRCLVAGFHVPTQLETAAGGPRVFGAAMKRWLEPGRHKLIASHARTQGLMVAAGNPLRLRGLPDVAASGARFVQRQPGSGTRLLLEHLLRAQRMSATDLGGAGAPPEDSHLAVAATIAAGEADTGLGLEAAAHQFGLDFLPLIEEQYLLVCLRDALENPAVGKLRTLLARPAWRALLLDLPGYAPAAGDAAGEVLSLTQALPWWRYRTPKRHRAVSTR